MTKLTKAELAKIATEVFVSNPKLNKVHQTTDGQCFERQDNAINHQLTLTPNGEDVSEVNRADDEKDENESGAGPELKHSELQDLCRANNLPEEEWIKFKAKKELRAYLNSKEVEMK